MENKEEKVTSTNSEKLKNIVDEEKKSKKSNKDKSDSDSNIAKAFDRLDHLATLGGNWDGEGALPISRQVINNLKRVLLISDDADWKDWQIGPDTNATLGLQSANTDACISIGTEEYSYYADINGKEHHASRVTFTPKSFLDVMRRIG